MWGRSPEQQEEQRIGITSQRGGLGEYGTISYCDCKRFGYRDSPLKYYTSSEIDTNYYDKSEVRFECDKMQFIALKEHVI